MDHSKHLSIVLSCIDYRFWPQALPLLQQKYGDFDLIEMAGACKNLTSPLDKDDKITLLENIETSIKLHGSQAIILTNHLDCGAYGGSVKFASPKEEIEFHEYELEKSKAIIQDKFPHLVIHTELLTINKNERISIL